MSSTPVPAVEVEVLATYDSSADLEGKRRWTPDKRMQLGPVGHIADERELLLGRSWEHFDAHLVAPTVGAVLHGVDLSGDLPIEVIDDVQIALDTYKVVFFREQHLTKDQHLRLARRFGELEVHPFLPSDDFQPELVRFDKGPDVGGYENNWHHDVTWRERPSKSTILRCVEAPPIGGDTLFADMCAAHDGLPGDLRAEIDGLSAVHSFERSFGSQVPDERKGEFRALYPEVEHPVVCTHDRTGRQFLYVNRVFVDRFVGRSHGESIDLLDRLCRQTDYPEYQCRFRWEPGSIAFWDNRSVQHYASSDYWPAVRVMERASIRGERPVA
jgi:taurine dioxygenase